MGLDNIGPIDRSKMAQGASLEQSDATGWMAFYALGMAAIASVLHQRGHRAGRGMVIKFLEHFATIHKALDDLGVWDPQDGFFYDQLNTASGTRVPVKVRSMVGVIPLLATAVVDQGTIKESETVGKHFAGFLRRHRADERGSGPARRGLVHGRPGQHQLLLSVVDLEQLRAVLRVLLDEAEFLSPAGLRSLSAAYRGRPYTLNVEGSTSSIDYEPAESTTPMFGGNSNWRGPVWFPLNYLLIESFERLHHFFGDELQFEYPTGSGTQLDLGAIAADLRRRLISIFTVDADGRRRCFGGVQRLQCDPAWKDHVLFNEYFNGDDGAGLGACHQTGWTGLVADLLCRPVTPAPTATGDAAQSPRGAQT